MASFNHQEFFKQYQQQQSLNTNNINYTKQQQLPSSQQLSYTSPTSADTIQHYYYGSVSDYLKDVFLDLQSRFLCNIPQEEFLDPVRFCFHIEESHWFYSDFHRHEARKQRIELPVWNFQEFAQEFLKSCDIKMTKQEFQNMLTQFNNYKLKIPVCGSIILNKELTHVVLIKGFNSSCWSFPRGKINKNETTVRCAIRETLEETGFDISKLIKQDAFIECQARNSPLQKLTFYIVICPEDKAETKIQFVPKARQEIEFVEWHNLSEVVNVLGLNGNTTIQDLKKNNNTINANNYWLITNQLRQLLKWFETNNLQAPIQQASVANSFATAQPVPILQSNPNGLMKKSSKRKLHYEDNSAQQAQNSVQKNKYNNGAPIVQVPQQSRSKFKPIRSKHAVNEQQQHNNDFDNAYLSRSLPNHYNSNIEQQQQQYLNNAQQYPPQKEYKQKQYNNNNKRRSSLNNNQEKNHQQNGAKSKSATTSPQNGHHQQRNHANDESTNKSLDVFSFDADAILQSF